MGCSDDLAPTATAPCCRRSCNLLSPGLACAAGEGGQIDTRGTLFPKHFVVEWE